MSALDLIRIPVLGADSVSLRVSALPRSGDFDPAAWRHAPLSRVLGVPGEWWELNIATLNLEDGDYEYDFVIERPGRAPLPVADPYAEEITRFGGYRGVLHCRNGHRVRLPFSWEGELPDGARLPDNNEIVIYELPMRWVDSPSDAAHRQVGLGTFDKGVFERLPYLQQLGVNAIELLPVQDSTDTLNWGYGTRFFFAPDIDMGEPADLKLFVKECHRRGMRVILDVVMNHSKACPLEVLAFDMFYLERNDEEPDPNGDGRNDWGGRLFRYRAPSHGAFHARHLHFGMIEYWIKEYHIDGLRIDEFKGIDNWDFIRELRDRAWQIQQFNFPGRPFIVVAEDSWRRAYVTQDMGAGPTVDSVWDFDFRDELRRLAAGRMYTSPGRPARSERVHALITGRRLWDDMRKGWRQRPAGGGSVDAGFSDLAQRVTYNTSHDVEGREEQRLLPYFAGELSHGWDEWNPTHADANLHPPALEQARHGIAIAMAQVHASFALMLTCAGIPMFLAGEEFADLHDIPHHDWRLKMSDPVDWHRAELPGHRELLARVVQLVRLRRGHAALQRNEVEFFGLSAARPGFHPAFDQSGGIRVFAYCRTAARPLGSAGQVIVIANCGVEAFASFLLDWPWGGMPLSESGGLGQPLPAAVEGRADLALDRFQVRVFST